MAEHTKFSERVQFDKDKDTMVRALKLMMGSEFDEVFKPVKQDNGTFLYPEEDLLPCEIWEECKKRLEDQHFDSGTNLKTELSLVLYRTGEDFMEFKGKFLDLTTQIKYQDPDDLPDTESIPTLLNSVVGWVDPSHPMHGTCQRISDDLDKMKKARRRNPTGRIKTKVTLASALDRLLKKANEVNRSQRDTALHARAAAHYIDSLDLCVPESEYAMAAHNLRGNNNTRYQRGVILDMNRAQQHAGGGGARRQQQYVNPAKCLLS